MVNIISIGTATPAHCHKQDDILAFMQKAYKLGNDDCRKLAYLYRHSEINQRYSVIEDFTSPEDQWTITTKTSLNDRLELFDANACTLSINAIKDCLKGWITPAEITHLITVSCTGMSAPGLDLQVAEELGLSSNVFRTSVNFMGCYAAIHALKLAQMICGTSATANVVIVCTEICTIHFQQEYTQDNAASSLLFGDGSAAVLVSNNIAKRNALQLRSFYSEISYNGKTDMSWKLSDTGFLMKLSSYVPDIIQHDISSLVEKALDHAGLSKEDISHWCLHPGGKKILEVIKAQLSLTDGDLACSKEVLWNYGNMSSPTILFVLKEMMKSMDEKPANIFGVAFGPGLTMETFIASKA